MSTIIQNLACFEVELDPKSHRFYFKEDMIKPDMIIENIILLFDNYKDEVNYQIGNPFSLTDTDTNARLTTPDEILGDNLFLNLSNDVDFVTNLFYKNVLALSGYTENLTLLNLNNKINTEKCFFNYSVNQVVRFLCYIQYSTKKTKRNIPLINGSFTVDIPIDPTKKYQDILLSDYIPQNFKNLNIKRITTNDGQYGYLYLKCKNNFIENIPLKFIGERNPKSDFLFDELNIDFTQSYLKYRNVITYIVPKYTLTFYY